MLLRKKLLIICIALALVSIVIYFFFSPHNKDLGVGSNPDIVVSNVPGYQYDNFWMKNVSISKRENDKIVLYLSTNKVVHRKRVSRFFVYQNLKELYMSGVQIAIYLYDTASDPANKGIALPIDDIASDFESIWKPHTPVELYLKGDADVNLDLLSRVLFEDLTITIYLPENKCVSLIAKRAKVNSDFKNIVLEEGVKVVTSDGKELRANMAVWSKRFNGIYIPSIYTLQNIKHNGNAFFIIDKNGHFLKAKVPHIEYTDPFEEQEEVLFAKLFKKILPYINFVFGTH